MKKYLGALLIFSLLNLPLQQCANPQPPTGGPKDTIPPTLINSEPPTGTLNFREQTIILEFSEHVAAEQLREKLIITPKSDIKFKHIAKKNLLVIKFEEPFDDSATYHLNFFDGVTDITERSPVKNLNIAFSTGAYIDSMSISGKVTDLITQTPSANYIVGLYPLTDSLDFLLDNPAYFTSTSDSGEFKMSYIQKGIYKILTFKDENNNLVLDSENESYGFKADSVALFQPLSDFSLSSYLQNVKPIKLINSRSVGPYVEIKFSREIHEYKLSPDTIYSNIVGSNKDVIRLYNPNKQFIYNDSIPLSLFATDSLGNFTEDTLFISFIESKRKSAEFSYSLSKPLKPQLVSNQNVIFEFNKPILSVDTSRIYFAYDSLFEYPVVHPRFEWNSNYTKLNLMTGIHPDSVFSSLEATLNLSGSDTSNLQSYPILLFAHKYAFLSVDADTTSTKSVTFSQTPAPLIGLLKIIANTTQESYRIQLLQNTAVAYESVNMEETMFRVTPGTYKIRVLIDTNNDGHWSYGNLLKNIEPEEIYLLPGKISVRENWDIELDIYF